MKHVTRIDRSFDDWDTEVMALLGRLMGRRRSPDDARKRDRKKDKAIIHKTVPEAVLYPGGQDAPEEDRSWLDAVPLVEPADPNVPETEAPPPERPAASRDEPEPVKADGIRADSEELPGQEANVEASARTRFPYGWLVVVEGPGVGEWFVLEGGVSHIGSAEGQTVRLDFGDTAIAPVRHAALTYDTGHHAFVLDGGPDAPVRLNGAAVRPQATLRDGDVVSLGGTSLRLVALCSPNFYWDPKTRSG